MSDYDVIVLGTGAAGLAAAIAASEGGARVGVFEKADLVGVPVPGRADKSGFRTTLINWRWARRTAARMRSLT